MHRFEQLTDDCVRALAWCIGAPGLMGVGSELPVPSVGDTEAELARAWDWLLALDRDPSPLHRYLARTSHWKVGLHFESLLTWWLMWHSEYQMLGHNLQIRSHGRTLGAFDYLLRDARGKALHWEVAVKFYLQLHDDERWSAWVGPNQRDRLDIKLARMRDHQLPLSQRPEASQPLASFQVFEPPERLAIVKGMFFEPWQGRGTRPIGSSRDAPIGQWVCQKDVEAFSTSLATFRWFERTKPDWLGPARRATRESMSTDEWVAQLQATPLVRPQLWSRLGFRDPNVWFEDLRVFVVPDTWPGAGRRETA